MKLTVKREPLLATEDTTPGIMLIDNRHYGYTLEDTRRGPGYKVMGKTAIPAGTYRVAITHSTRWDKPMIQVYNTDDLRVEGEGIEFSGVRIHGGNDHHDTAGCILIGDRRTSITRIQNSLSSDLTAMVSEYIATGDECWLEVLD